MANKTLNFDNDTDCIELTVKGKSYTLEYPEWGLVEKMEKKVEEKTFTTKDAKDFLNICGLDDVGISGLKSHQVSKVYEELMAGGKPS